MTDYISREAAYSIAKKVVDAIANGEYHTGVFAYDIMDWIDDLPAADVRPLVRGKWIKINGLTACSVCKENPPRTYHNFCPNCGADMREDNNG